MSKKSTVSVIGLGYMGLPMACVLAKVGYEVLGVDVDEKKIKELKGGRAPFSEPGLKELLEENYKKLSFFTKPQPADAHVVAVPTPITKKKGVELKYVIKAMESLVPVLRDGDLVILESTVGPASHRLVGKILDKSGRKYLLAHCPERAFPGNTLYEMVNNDRIVGGLTPEATEAANRIYKKFVKGDILLTDIATAEAVKLLENTYRAVNIGLANEVAALAYKWGFNVWEAIALANHHPRVNVHQPGPGVGGHCIPLDPWFLIEGEWKNSPIIRHSLLLNASMPRFVADLLVGEARRRKIKIRKIGILGVAYKKNVDDAREAPAEILYEVLGKKKYQVRASDPFVSEAGMELYPEAEVLRWADAVIITTDHDRYKKLDFGKRKNLKLVLDTRNCLSDAQRDALKNKAVILGDGAGK